MDITEYQSGRDASRQLRCDHQKTLPRLLGPPHATLISGSRCLSLWRRQHVLDVWHKRFPAGNNTAETRYQLILRTRRERYDSRRKAREA
jgi:hypothetical protein